jgi:hypothetical protein
MVLTCLGRNSSSNSGSLFSWSSVQCRIFQLASTCVSTPWNDGSFTSITNTLKRAAMKASMERDESVSMAAKDALRVCDLFGVPRAPPLVFVHRTVNEESDRVETSASEIIEGIQKAQEEAKRARAAMEKAEKAKAQEKRQREAEREESNKRKREAKEKRMEAPVQDADKDVVVATGQESTKTTQNDDAMEMEVEVDADGKDDANATNKEKDTPGEVEESDGQAENEEVGDDFDEDFPDIVAGGPDSDDD